MKKKLTPTQKVRFNISKNWKQKNAAPPKRDYVPSHLRAGFDESKVIKL